MKQEGTKSDQTKKSSHFMDTINISKTLSHITLSPINFISYLISTEKPLSNNSDCTKWVFVHKKIYLF